MSKYKKYIIMLLLLVEVFSVYLTFKSYAYKEIDKIDEVYEVDKKMFAMYIENDSGEYDEYTDSNYWPSGYKLNESMTMCIDNKGNNITVNSLIFDNNKMTVQSNKTIFCYLYFDIDKSVYAKVVSDYNNSNGVSKTSSTSTATGNAYDVYYYTGNITNNNILYGGYCWKMVITTETNGVKLIYNGVPDKADDGTLTCNNTGEESQIGKSKFNSSYNSPANVGYMYNTMYEYANRQGFTNSTNVYSRYRMNSSYIYYYGDEAVWNEETGKYDLKLSDGTDVTETTTWSSSTYSSLVGKYTCLSTTATSCATVYYIAGASSSYMYYYALTNNTTKDDYKIKLATVITDNGDGTYTLVDPVEVSKADWPNVHSNYKNYYYCNDLTSETCGANNTTMYYSTSTSKTILTGANRANVYKYGNSLTYENGTYKLIDTKEFWNWPNNYNTLNSNHYTCFNTTGECEKVYYIYKTSAMYAHNITLKDGKTIETALNEMLYADDVNTTDSTIKAYIDEWYEGAILDKTDGNGVLYSSYLENTIFCNNRATTNLSASGWNPNGGSTAVESIIFNYNSLECENKTDQFTLKVEAGGTEGYGNNALDYPIGLITYKEASLVGAFSTYLKSGSNYWLLSPDSFYGDSNYSTKSRYINTYGQNSFDFLWNGYGVRPSVSLSNKVEITSGDGSVTLPYQVVLPSE